MNLVPNSLAARMSLGLGVSLVFGAISTTAGLIQASRSNATLETVVTRDNALVANVVSMPRAVDQIAISVRDAALSNDPSEIKRQLARLNVAEHTYRASGKQLETAIQTDASMAREPELTAEVARGAERTLLLLRQVSHAGEVGAAVEAGDLLEKSVRPEEVPWRAKLDELQTRIKKASEDRSVASSSAAAQTQRVVVGACLVGAIIAGLLARMLVVSIVVPIRQATKLAEKVAHGDLTSKISARGASEMLRLLKAIDAMQGHLRMIVDGIRTASSQVRDSIAEVAQGNLDLSERTDTSSSGLQAASSEISSLAGMLRRSEESSQRASQMAGDATSIAQARRAAPERLSKTIQAVSESSKEIQTITGVIDGIAFQTNILALNAAIEEARAGEHGKGFSVVASEVRHLAQRSAEAAREISGLIDKSSHEVLAGAAHVGTVHEKSIEIEQSTSTVDSMINAISQNVRLQANAVSLVSSAVSEIDGMSQQNAALVEQSAAAATSLTGQAVALANLVDQFKSH